MRVILGFGGNLGDVPGVFLRASKELAGPLCVLEISRLYRSEALGPPQPRYWNMAVLADVNIPVRRLLARCQQLEAGAGRDRDAEIMWGPRPLDIDLLIGCSVVHRGPDLVLPHPRLHERAFALVPAAELAPRWVHPVLGSSIAELAEQAVARDPGALELVGTLEDCQDRDSNSGRGPLGLLRPTS